MLALALHIQVGVCAYLNILQLGLHSRAVFCCLDGLALHISQQAVHVIQFSLWKTGKKQNKSTSEQKQHIIDFKFSNLIT